VKKYESNNFSGIVSVYPTGTTLRVTGPDSNGKYSIVKDGYVDSTSTSYEISCKTIYGPDWRNNNGVTKIFYFSKK